MSLSKTILHRRESFNKHPALQITLAWRGKFSSSNNKLANMANNIAVIGSSVVLLVAVVAVVAVTVSSNKASPAGSSDVTGPAGLSTSSKAVQSLCMPTDYRQTCEFALDGVAGDTTDPKELIQLGFNVTISHIRGAFDQSKVIQEAAKDPKSSKALETCREQLDYAIDDLRTSFEKLAGIDMSQVDSAVNDLQSWLAAAYTYQDICLDEFEDVGSPAAVGMQKALNTSMEMTSNINVMIEQIQTVLLKDFDISSLGGSRKLLAAEGDGLPPWVSSARRRLLAVPLTELAPQVTVAQDGSGNFKTIKEALGAVPKKNPTPFVIHIKAGIYKEQILIDKSQPNVVLVGDGATKTIITYGSNFGKEGTGTSKTATVAVQGPNFMARDIGFENSAGPEGHQAVALRINADLSVVYNCRMDGYQDTLYAQNYRQYYRDCTITGTIDFIFGNGIAILQNCLILVRKPLDNQQNMVTAQGRMDRHLATALVLQNCTIVPDASLVPSVAKHPTYLGRPWKQYARTVFLQNYIDGFISPDGYTPWLDDNKRPVNYKSCYYTELGNRGPGADTSKRVNWPSIKKINAKQAEKYTVARFLQGNKWLPATGVPFIPGMLPN